MAKHNVEDYIGKKIYHLTILEDLGTRGKDYVRYVKVQCDCPKETIKEIRFGSLFTKTNTTKSCGCLKEKNIINSNLKHGMSKSHEYKCWLKMRERCYDKNNNRYYCYGGRGIIVCESWINSFETFLKDVGRSPTNRHSIDRIDTEKNYEPGNVKWSDYVEQANNKRNNRLLTLGERTQTLAQWSEETGIKRTTISQRIDIRGWTVEEALTIMP